MCKHVDQVQKYAIDDWEVEILSARHPPSPMASPRDPMNPMLFYTGPSTECSSARSGWNCSEAFFTNRSSDISWVDGYETEDSGKDPHEDGALLHSRDDFVGSSCGVEPEMSTSVLAECCCKKSHALALNDGQLWCPECLTWVSWPIWPHVSACKFARLPQTPPLPPSDTSTPPDEAASLCAFGGTCYRAGIGGGTRVEPGFRAGGGTAGPWWSRTDSRFLGK